MDGTDIAAQLQELNTSPWKALPQDWGDGEMVKIIDDPAEWEAPIMELLPETLPERPKPEREARLVHRASAEDHHDAALRQITETTRLALDTLDLPKTGTRAWIRSINYHEDVASQIEQAVDALGEALALIDLHETR